MKFPGAKLLGQGLALFAVGSAVWFIGPLLEFAGRWRPLESEIARTNLIGFVLGSMLLHAWWTRRRRTPALNSRGAGPRVHAWSLVFIALVVAGVLAGWAVDAVRQRALVSELTVRIEALHERLQSHEASALNDPAVLLPLLKSVRDSAPGASGYDEAFSFGLSQVSRLDAAVHAAYRQLLRDTLWPRIVKDIELDLRQRASGTGTEGVYQALKAYLMLFDAEHFDSAFMASYVSMNWAPRLQSDVAGGAALAAMLDDHLKALFADGALEAGLIRDDGLVQKARGLVAGQPLAARVDDRVRLLAGTSRETSFDMVKAVGPDASAVFVRASGAPLNQGIPGLYTSNEYRNSVHRTVDRVAYELASEQAWVLGEPGAIRAAALVDNVRRAYLNNYVRVWETYLSDIRLAPTRDLGALVQLARKLSGTDGLLRPFIQAVARETTLASGSLADKAADAMAANRAQLNKFLGVPAQAADASRLEHIVDDRFAGLRRLTAVPDGRAQAPIDDVLAQMDALYGWLFAAQEALGRGAPPPASDLPLRLRAEAARLPEPLRGWLSDLSARSETLVSSGASKRG